MSLAPVLSSSFWLTDPTLGGGDGWTVTELVPDLPFGWTNLGFGPSVLQPDGKIVMSGLYSDGLFSTNEHALLRYNPDGTLDATFGTGGLVVTLDSNQTTFGWAITLRPDNDILLVGRMAGATAADPADFGLLLYNPGGSLDESFGIGGIATANFTPYDHAYCATATADGKIVVAGQAFIFYTDPSVWSPTNWFALSRFNADGSLDTSFGEDGVTLTDMGGYDDRILAIATQADGKIVAVGANDTDFALARYNADGSLDLTFGAGGVLTTDFVGASDVAHSVAVQADGKILVAGTTSQGGTQIALARYNSDGTLDTTFDGDGLAVGTANVGGDSLALLPDGKFLIAGANSAGIALVRYNADGSVDTSFHGGFATFTEDGGMELAAGSAHLLIQPGGGIAVTAGTTNGAAIAHFVAGGGIPNTEMSAGVVSSLSFSGLFVDPDGGSITYSASLEGGGALPAWLTFDSGEGVLSAQPALTHLGSISIELTATDLNGDTASDVFLLDVEWAPVDGGMAGDTIPGSAEDDSIRGLGGDDSLDGGVGGDLLRGNPGNDTLVGGDGNDWLAAGQNNDSLLGGDGDDVLRARLGNDTVEGGTGADTFWFHAAGPADADVVSDFVPGTDVIELDSSQAFAGLSNPVGFESGAGATATTSAATVLYDTATGNLSYDVDGNGANAPLLIATLTGAPALSAADISIV